MIDVSVIIVTWNVQDCIGDCLESLCKYMKGSYEILIIDNDSQDDTISIIEKYMEKHAEIKLIKLKYNLGFGKANNIGIANVCGKYTFLLNPDTIMIEEICSTMIKYLEIKQKVGIIAPRLLNKNQTYQLSVANFPNPKIYLLNQLHIGRICPNWVRKMYFQSDCTLKKNRYVDWAVGAALFMRTSDIRQVGGFDENYYMYGEDVRLCKDFLSTLNLKVYYVYDITIVHLGGQSEKQVIGKNKIYYGTWAVLKYIKDFYDIKTTKKMSKLIIAENRIKYLLCFFSHKDKKQISNLRKSYKQFIDASRSIIKDMVGE